MDDPYLGTSNPSDPVADPGARILSPKEAGMDIVGDMSTDTRMSINREKNRLKSFSYSQWKIDSEIDEMAYATRVAALELMREMEQAHDDGMLEKHHAAVLEQNERHHKEDLEQLSIQFTQSIKVSKTSNRVAIVAALAAIVAALFAGVSVQQSKTSPALPIVPQSQQQQIPSTVGPNIAPSEKVLQSSTISQADDPATKTLPPTAPPPQPTPKSSESGSRN